MSCLSPLQASWSLYAACLTWKPVGAPPAAHLVKGQGSRSNQTYLLFLPLRESAADELAFCVNVVMSAEDDEKPAVSLGIENSFPSWKSLFLNAS